MGPVSTSNQNQEEPRSVESISPSNPIHDRQNDMDLIYHVNRSTEEKRLCISPECVADILAFAHGRGQGHSGFEATFEIVSRSWYIRGLIKTLRAYVRNCSQCLQIQIRRHRSWDSLQSIHSSSVSFHTIAMDFVLGLLKIKDGVDCVLSVTNKFIKRIMLISGKFTYTAED